MTSIAESTAVDRAIARVATVLNTNLATQLAVAEVAVTNLPLPAPASASDYYIEIAEDLIDEAISNSEVAVYLTQASDTVVEVPVTRTSTKSGAIQSVEIAVNLVFRVTLHEAVTYLGKTLTSREVMRLRAHRYNAGVIRVMRQYAVDGTVVHHAEKVSELPSRLRLSEKSQPLWGMASSLWRLHQDIDVLYTL